MINQFEQEFDFDEEIMSVITGKTFQHIISLSDVMPIETNSEQRRQICSSLICICKALDSNKIMFNDEMDEAMLFGLMSVALKIFLDGREYKPDGKLH